MPFVTKETVNAAEVRIPLISDLSTSLGENGIYCIFLQLAHAAALCADRNTYGIIAAAQIMHKELLNSALRTQTRGEYAIHTGEKQKANTHTSTSPSDLS